MYLKNKPILINFLNAVIKSTVSIKDVKIKNNYIDKDFIKNKFSRLDVKATTSNKEHINIEIQVRYISTKNIDRYEIVECC